MAYRSTKLQQEQTNFMDASTGDLRANVPVERLPITSAPNRQLYKSAPTGLLCGCLGYERLMRLPSENISNANNEMPVRASKLVSNLAKSLPGVRAGNPIVLKVARL